MKKKRRLKALLAGVFLTAVLGLPLAVMVGADPTPALSFEGVELEILPDGSAQMLFTAYVSNVRYSDGARFILDYNPNYLVPSDQTTNAALVQPSDQSPINNAAYFAASATLYQESGAPQNPFKTTNTKGQYSQIDPAEYTVSMALWTRSNLKAGGGLEKLEVGEGEVANILYVFDSLTTESKKVALGTLSFRVTDPSILPELVERFGGGKIDDTADPTVGGDYLIRMNTQADARGVWAVGACLGSNAALNHYELNEKTAPSIGTAQRSFTFSFPKTVIRVEAAEAELTLDAYRAYTHGDEGDIAIAMQKYSPMATATYADGSQRSFLLSWDGCRVAWPGKEDGAVPYTAVGGTYDIEQDFYYYKTDADEAAGIEKAKFALPVTARLTVTPITLQGVSAAELHRTYPLNDALVGDDGVQTAAQLKLPSQARLVTDIPAGGASLTMDIPGWSPSRSDSRWPGTDETMETLLADESAADHVIHWPTNLDTGRWGEIEGATTVTDHRRGVYTFQMAESYGGVPASFLREDISDAYPWLTVPQPAYDLEEATRRLVREDEQVDVSRYRVEYLSTTTNAHRQPELTLQVSKTTQAGGGQTQDMSAASVFRVLLPDGSELGTGLSSTGAVGGSVTVPDWFADQAANFGSYEKREDRTLGEYGDKRGFDLTTTPGDTSDTAQTAAAERERLRRYINLGGWFAVSINENPDICAWSDYIPVYVPPRANEHTADKEYNFIGANAGLFGWPGGVSTTVTLPKGNYRPVDSAGVPLYEGDGVTRRTERYGVATTYDGATGAEPGELNTFTVDGWTTGVDGSITTHGPDPFRDDALYGSYGRVWNTDGKQATLRLETNPPAQTMEGITLTYAGRSGVTSGSDGNVNLVTYDTRTQGYTIRQDYELIITNVGTGDLYDLDIDTLTDIDDDGDHFMLLKPPAAFLPAGGSTTFTLTYSYDLRANGGRPVDYKDKLFITSTSKCTVPGAEKTDYLLDFDAQFQVSAEDIHRVTVLTDPADGCMGTAVVVIGEEEDPGAQPQFAMNTTPGTTAFRKDATVYIMVSPKDEYVVETFTCIDSSGAIIPMTPYVSGDGSTASRAEVPKGKTIYTFTMPDYDATVTIKLKEPISSKLRLSDMRAFAGKEESMLTPPGAGEEDKRPECKVWQKSFTEAEQRSAEAWSGSHGDAPVGQYLMTCGTADKADFQVPGYDQTVEQYLVVLPYEADYAQVEVTLRKVVHTLLNPATGVEENPDIEPWVSMWLYPKDPVKDASVTADGILSPAQQGNTATPTTHTSRTFDAPEPGSSVYVRVDLAYTEDTVTTTRSYYLELHRAPKRVIAALHYGNSPYGVIMNDPAIDGENEDTDGLTDKDRAKAAFVANGYSFHGLTSIPAVVAGSGLENARYWTEAWVDVNALYDPESHIGMDLYDPAKNLDLSDYAFFATLSEDFEDPGLASALDSSGRPVDVSKATISLEAVTLDVHALTQAGRFAGPDPADADLVEARTVTLDLGDAGKTVAAGWEDGNALRPGRYELKYSFSDYGDTDTLTVIRPFVILAPVGDVDADGSVTIGARGDESAVKDRLTDPLGYEAQEYADAALFKLRTCDANNDRNINNIDANAIYRSVKEPSKLLQRFYLSTGYKPAAAP